MDYLHQEVGSTRRTSIMKKILIPTDFSLCAQAATEVAIEIAQVFKAHAYFLHIIPDSLTTHHVPSERQNKMEHDPEAGKAQAKLNDLVQQAERKGVAATPVLVLSKVNDHIEDYVKPYEIDWIVMGSHGVTGIREMVLGSHTERVVKHAAVPVLVIKKRPKIIRFRNIVFASTFEQEDLYDAMGDCLDFAKPYEAQVHLLYLNFTNRLVQEATAREKMKRLADLFPLYSFTANIIETNDAEWGIDEFVREAGGDLIAILPHDTEGAIRMMARRIALSLVNHESIPVLVLNAKQP